MKQAENINDARGFFLYLSTKNDYDYLLRKTCEELTELMELLLKTLNKKEDKRPSLESIVEEIGDVEMRLLMLKNRMKISPDMIDARKIYKANKFITYLKEGICKEATL